ncbi:CYTH domain protein [Asticcacaulis biprosthecium C19]|uniref:CYTH domain protein n=1 Tax=Asticcacaulis biprosthecium C19 TaxID=715226 RepID=F4QJA3_9CAUL|nr:CYTH domain-containing protein [Asticcacaulis biprosthecium]EGF91934.1 CYTH domain protein [Asticcacaulis biprosthecium C19]
MGTEIERKFLVSGDFRSSATSQHRIVQGYLTTNADCTVRVRLMDDKAFLTIKGSSSEDGLERAEWEYPVPVADAEAMLALPGIRSLAKVRFKVPVGKHVWEVDVFEGANAGLIMAEVELGSRDEGFERPEWIGREVTGDARYYNSQLLTKPYRSWE